MLLLLLMLFKKRMKRILMSMGFIGQKKILISPQTPLRVRPRRLD